MTRGPRPTPSSVLGLRGSWRANERGDVGADLAPIERAAPAWLDEYGMAQWAHLVPILEAMAVLTEADYSALAVHCETWADYRRCVDAMRRNDGVTVEVETAQNGTFSKELMEATRAKQLLPVLAAQFREFGLTPSARANIAPKAKAEKKQAKGRFFEGKTG